MDNSSLHHAIIESFLARERPPAVEELASRFGCDEAAVRAALGALADDHGVVLHPHSGEVWIAHPFSAAPTPWIVRAGARRWWGNCAWCSLGVARLAGGDVTITTSPGALDEQVTLRIDRGELLDKDYVVHFPIPMARAWENVVYTCSVMLLFRDQAQVDGWCSVRGVARGDVRPLEQIWRMASEWYGKHADRGWRKWTTSEAADIFARHGLDGPTWSVAAESARF